MMDSILMDDRRRVRLAALCSAAAHVLFLMAAAYGFNRTPAGFGPGEGPPLVLNLRPAAPESEPQPEAMKRLVEAGTPAAAPVKTTDLISTRDSVASDLSNTSGDVTAPAVDEVAEFDALGSPAPVQAIIAPPPPPALKPATKDKAPSATPLESKEMLGPALAATEPSENPGSAQDGSAEEKMQLAKAEDTLLGDTTKRVPPSLPQPGSSAGPSRGRAPGGAITKGFVSFEAMRNEFAPYLREVQKRVEKRWHTMLQMKYSGTTPTKAVLDCAIGSDGTVVYVRIVDAGDSLTFAPICKEALEKAGPFPVFPFTVPDVYRSKNLEIRWTFSFL